MGHYFLDIEYNEHDMINFLGPTFDLDTIESQVRAGVTRETNF